MRKITKEMAVAFKKGIRATKGNTRVICCCHAYHADQTIHMYLHGNPIASLCGTRLTLSLCGWNAPITRERLNGVLEVLGVCGRFTQRKGLPYFDNNLIEADATISVDIRLN